MEYLANKVMNKGYRVGDYRQIESDLLDSEECLPEPSTVSVGTASASLAKAILADLYLTWGGWPGRMRPQVSPRLRQRPRRLDYNYHLLLSIGAMWTIAGGQSRETIFSRICK